VKRLATRGIANRTASRPPCPEHQSCRNAPTREGSAALGPCVETTWGRSPAMLPERARINSCFPRYLPELVDRECTGKQGIMFCGADEKSMRILRPDRHQTINWAFHNTIPRDITLEEYLIFGLSDCQRAVSQVRRYTCVTDRTLPSGSLNHAMRAPLGEVQTPRSS
jgi:hypothetical protein